MKRIRTFIAVEPGKAIRDRMVSLQETIARVGVAVKWVEPENLHVTLLFLGEVDDRKVPEVCKLVQTVVQKHAPFTMYVETVGCFPNNRRPRVLWVGVGEGAQAICTLHDDLEGPLQDLGYRREARRYTPHITLGRVKSEGDASSLTLELTRRAGWKAGEILIREIHVMSSELTSDGPIYTVLSRCKLT